MIRILLLASALVLTACAADLPAGWESAERVELRRGDCKGSALNEHQERLEVGVASGRVQLAYKDAHFRCAQEVEGYVRRGAGTVELLVQPVDMDPGTVAGCDCLSDIDAELPAAEGAITARLFRRWDNLNQPNDPVAIGSVELTVPR